MKDLIKANNRYHKSMLGLALTFLVIGLVVLSGLVLAYSDKNAQLNSRVNQLNDLLAKNQPALDKIDTAVTELRADNANQTRLLCQLILNNGLASNDKLCQDYINQYQPSLVEPSFKAPEAPAKPQSSVSTTPSQNQPQPAQNGSEDNQTKQPQNCTLDLLFVHVGCPEVKP